MVKYMLGDQQSCCDLFSDAVKVEKRLGKGMEGVAEMRQEGYYFSEEQLIYLDEMIQLCNQKEANSAP